MRDLTNIVGGLIRKPCKPFFFFGGEKKKSRNRRDECRARAFDATPPCVFVAKALAKPVKFLAMLRSGDAIRHPCGSPRLPRLHQIGQVLSRAPDVVATKPGGAAARIVKD